MTPHEETRLIERVKSGDADAFEALVIENQKRVYNLAARITGSQYDALDISQEVFLKAWSGISGFRGESRFSAWLYRMTYNLCIDFLRRQARTRTLPLEYRERDGVIYDLEIPDIRNEPSAVAERRETGRLIESAIDRLPPNMREIIILREVTGMSYGEIAEILQLSDGTVKSRLARARQRLSEILMQNGTFSDHTRLDRRMEGGEDHA